MRRILGRSFKRKLLLFVLLAVVVTTLLQSLYLINNFGQITEYALERNTAGTEQTVREFLEKYAQERAESTRLQLAAAQANLSVLGRSAQKIVDDYDSIRAEPALLNLALFQTPLEERNGALAAPAGAAVDTLIPPSLAGDPRAQELLEASALLNLSMEAVFAGNPNNIFLYFVGDEGAPVTRAFPNIDLASALGANVDLHFWNDFFPGTVSSWTRYYSDPELRASLGDNPITVVGPYEDAAGQGAVLTMFYPLWDYERNRFAGAVGADIGIQSIVENFLTFSVADTGFAFLMDSAGETIALPELGVEPLGISLERVDRVQSFYDRAVLANSANPEVRALAAEILATESGFGEITVQSQSGPRTELVSYATLPPIARSDYSPDAWKIVVAVPRDEILAVLNATDADVRARSAQLSLASLGIVLGSLLLVGLISYRLSDSVTRDLRTLAGAARGVADKRYDVEVSLRSEDEIGQLGQAFTAMSREIRDYTNNLEQKVADRTAELQRANAEISRLNAQLRDENLRLGAELDVARRLQMMVLPPERETRAVPELDIAGYMRPADEVGGDYYDVLRVGDAVYLGIGDVTGHGLPAGVVMLMAQTAFLTLSQSGEQDLRRILAVMNKVLYHNILRIEDDKNMTLAVLQYRQNEISVVGQHESVLVCRADGAVEVIDTIDLGLPMGLEADIAEFVDARQLRLEQGDVMVLYTDGVTEAESPGRAQYGVGNLVLSLSAHHRGSAEEIKAGILADLYAFIGEARIYDDIALLVVKQR